MLDTGNVWRIRPVSLWMLFPRLDKRSLILGYFLFPFLNRVEKTMRLSLGSSDV